MKDSSNYKKVLIVQLIYIGFLVFISLLSFLQEKLIIFSNVSLVLFYVLSIVAFFGIIVILVFKAFNKNIINSNGIAVFYIVFSFISLGLLLFSVLIANGIRDKKAFIPNASSVEAYIYDVEKNVKVAYVWDRCRINSDIARCRNRLPNSVDYYSVSFSYYFKYEVDGKSYQSLYIGRTKNYENEIDMKNAQPEYKEGGYLMIYYNLDDPSDVRVNFIGVSSNLLYIFFACDLFICLIVFLVNYRLYRKTK